MLEPVIDLCHGTASLLKFYQTVIKHIIGKNKPSLVLAPIFRVADQSTVKCHHFENCHFCKILYGERAKHAHSAHLPYKTLLITIFKLMLPHDTLVYDSDNWSTY